MNTFAKALLLTGVVALAACSNKNDFAGDDVVDLNNPGGAGAGVSIDEYNLALGARRANTARDYLVSQGVPASRLKVVSFGKERPIEICSVESCYAKNRRSVTVLAGGVSG